MSVLRCHQRVAKSSLGILCAFVTMSVCVCVCVSVCKSLNPFHRYNVIGVENPQLSPRRHSSHTGHWVPISEDGLLSLLFCHLFVCHVLRCVWCFLDKTLRFFFLFWGWSRKVKEKGVNTSTLWRHLWDFVQLPLLCMCCTFVLELYLLYQTCGNVDSVIRANLRYIRHGKLFQLPRYFSVWTVFFHFSQWAVWASCLHFHLSVHLGTFHIQEKKKKILHNHCFQLEHEFPC